MSTDTHDTPDNPYRKRDPWGARAAIPQVFTVQPAPAPVRRVFKPAPQTPLVQTPRSLLPESKPVRNRLQLTPVAEPYDEPPPSRREPAPASDLGSARLPPFAGAATPPTPERVRNSFVGAAPLAKSEPAKPVEPRVPAEPAPAPIAAPSRLAPFARSDPAPRPVSESRPAPAPKPEPEAKLVEPVAPRPVPAAAIAPPVGGFALERAMGGRRHRRPLPRGLLAASLLVLAGVAAVAAAVVIKPWAHHPSAVDALAAQSAKPPAPLTITPADPFAGSAVSPPSATPSAATPLRTATASLAPHAGRAAQGAATPGAVPTDASVTPPAADAAPQSGASQPAAAPPKVAPAPIVVSPPPEMDVKPAAAPAPEPAKAAPPKPASETISTSHLPGDSVGPHQ